MFLLLRVSEDEVEREDDADEQTEGDVEHHHRRERHDPHSLKMTSTSTTCINETNVTTYFLMSVCIHSK